jgi:lipopolysaccharide heptosyltransferase II
MKVLIIRLSALGDVIQGIPGLVALKESFPDWEISWLVEEPWAPVLDRHPCLRKLFILERRWRSERLGTPPHQLFHGFLNMVAIRRQLQRERFDIAIDLQGLFKSGLWSWLSGTPRRIGHDRTRECAHWFLNEYVCDRPTFDPSYPLIQRYLDPARYLGADVTRARYVLPHSRPETVAAVDALLGPASGAATTIALCPWSAWVSKNWPLDKWKEISLALAGNYRVLILGSPTEKPAADTIWMPSAAAEPAARNGILNLVGQTDLSTLAEIFRRCRVVAGPDTGPIHLANATGVPKILMLFGSTSWRRSGPFGDGHRTLSRNLECQPCFERVCPLGHLNCIHQLKTGEILDAIHELVRGTAPEKK